MVDPGMVQMASSSVALPVASLVHLELAEPAVVEVDVVLEFLVLGLVLVFDRTFVESPAADMGSV